MVALKSCGSVENYLFTPMNSPTLLLTRFSMHPQVQDDCFMCWIAYRLMLLEEPCLAHFALGMLRQFAKDLHPNCVILMIT